jgi:hypothetical protein
LARELRVNIVGDSRDLERAFARSEKSAQRFGRAMKGALAGGIAGVGLTKILTDTVKAASNLQESMSKTNAVFGQSSKDITDWSKKTATAFGISERAALETASSFGALFGPLGIVGAAAADQSRKLTELGADLASFYNTDVQSALDAIRSGLVGESEPLRRYGALLSETRVQQEAMAETGKKNATSLTDQEKVLARIALIFEDTTVAQGDFQRTSGGLAGQTKILQAQLEDLQATLGEALLPYITDIAKRTNLWLSDMENRQMVVDNFAASMHTLAGAMEAVARTASVGHGAWSRFVEVFQNLPGAPSSSPMVPSFFKTGPAGFAGRAGGAGGRGGLPGTGQGAVDDLLNKVRSIAAIGQANSAIGQLTQFIAKYTAMGKKWEDTQKAMAARRAAAQLRQQRIAAGRQNVLGWLDFGLERAESTKSNRDNLKVLRRREQILKSWIASSGRTLNLVRELWRTQDQIRNLNKKNSDRDPLAGLMQVSSKRLAQVLATGTGIGRGGMGRLEANIAGQEIHNYVILDGRQVAHSVNTHQTRGSARTARQTSGFRG